MAGSGGGREVTGLGSQTRVCIVPADARLRYFNEAADNVGFASLFQACRVPLLIGCAYAIHIQDPGPTHIGRFACIVCSMFGHLRH